MFKGQVLQPVLFLWIKASESVYRFSGVLKKSLILIESIGLHRTFVPETSRNKGVRLSTY
jgi:hypothetical protein